MEIKTYRNKRNPHKFILVKHTNDRHYMWKQQLRFDNGVVNDTLPFFSRATKGIREEVLADYEEVR